MAATPVNAYVEGEFILRRRWLHTVRLKLLEINLLARNLLGKHVFQPFVFIVSSQ